MTTAKLLLAITSVIFIASFVLCITTLTSANIAQLEPIDQLAFMRFSVLLLAAASVLWLVTYVNWLFKND